MLAILLHACFLQQSVSIDNVISVACAERVRFYLSLENRPTASAIRHIPFFVLLRQLEIDLLHC